ncbi:LysR family transcriptional regulator [Kiloniella majae]|uniref:LysR family transcriptional regulator n=1 Tax=Kiloniella majae TaxID=1938558 RepID=UPI000A278E4F|nr:LysR family transcriptional regulator [Kiloniella majae]
MDLDNLTLFLRIVEKGGMAAAGRELGLSPASVSERLAALEAYYGASLLNRTTRSISLTDEGRELVSGARRILAEADEVQSRIKLGVEKISGTIHISAPIDLGYNRIVPLLDSFMERHPEISINLTLTDGYVDLVGQGLDFALRLGVLADSSLRIKKLGDNRRVVCASPDYLKKNGTPGHPEDLIHHNCILMRFGNQVDHAWRFDVEGRQKKYFVRGNRTVNDGHLVRIWCRAGHGFALKSIWDIQDDLKSGALVPVLEEFAAVPAALQIVYPDGATQPRRVRLLIDHLAHWFEHNQVTLPKEE